MNRSAIKTALDTLVTGALPGVQVTREWLGSEMSPEHVYFAGTEGPVDRGPAKAGPQWRDDRFTVLLSFVSAAVKLAAGWDQHTSAAEAETRVEAMVDAVMSDLAADATLGGTVIEARTARVEGPNTAKTDEGRVGWALVELEIHARYTT